MINIIPTTLEVFLTGARNRCPFTAGFNGDEGTCSRLENSPIIIHERERTPEKINQTWASIIQNSTVISKEFKEATTIDSNSGGTPNQSQAVANPYQPPIQHVDKERQTRIEGITLLKPNVVNIDLSDIEDEIHYW